MAREFVVVLAAAVKILDSTNEEDLEGGHQRRGARPVEDVLQVHLAQVHVVDAEFAHIRGHQMLEDGVAAPLAEKRLIADEDISGRQLARLHVGDEAVRSSKTPHLVGLQDVAHQRLAKLLAMRPQGRAPLPRKNWERPARPDTARGKDSWDSPRGPCPCWFSAMPSS